MTRRDNGVSECADILGWMEVVEIIQRRRDGFVEALPSAVERPCIPSTVALMENAFPAILCGVFFCRMTHLWNPFWKGYFAECLVLFAHKFISFCVKSILNNCFMNSLPRAPARAPIKRARASTRSFRSSQFYIPVMREGSIVRFCAVLCILFYR